jgi:hypothetical protein
VEHVSEYYEQIFRGRELSERDPMANRIANRVFLRIRRGQGFDSREGFKTYLRSNTYKDKRKYIKSESRRHRRLVPIEASDALVAAADIAEEESGGARERLEAAYSQAHATIESIILFFRTEVNERRWRSSRPLFVSERLEVVAATFLQIIATALQRFGTGPIAYWEKVRHAGLRKEWERGRKRFLKFWNGSANATDEPLTRERLEQAFTLSQEWHELIQGDADDSQA